MKYRAEVDGLRAVAVIPVILVHAGFGIFSGGFLGVDVFFVISGFLITRIISQEITENRFSLFEFYERRARRILPALFFVLFATTLIAALTLFPSDYRRFGQSLLATATFLSNAYFYLSSDYFAPASEQLPLIHTWSLAVEEQFYIFFPILLLFTARFSKKVNFCIILALSICSLVLAQFLINYDSAAAFYLLPSRAWELGAGALCAITILNRPRPKSEVATSIGLFMILASFILYDQHTPTPSMLTLLPVCGASLILVFGSTTGIAGRILSSKVMVWIGLISYSAYLWHQPIFALVRSASGIEPPAILMGALCVLSLLLAHLTRIFIESPFRRRTSGLFSSRKGIFSAAGTGLLALFVAGFAIHISNGFPNRIDEKTKFLLAARQDRSPQTKTCLVTIDALQTLPEVAPDECFWPHLTQSNKGLVVIVGDSHANAIAGALSAVLPRSGYDFRQITIRGCAPFLGFRKDASNRNCHAANLLVRERLKALQPDQIIVMWRGTSMFMDQFDNGEGGVDHQTYAGMNLEKDYYPDLIGRNKEAQALAVFRRGLSELAGFGALVIIGPVPEAGWNVPETYARFARWRKSESLSTSRRLFDERNQALLALLENLESEGSRVIYPHDELCHDQRCINAIGDQIYYFDDDHLSNAGAHMLAPAVLKALE